MTTPQATWQQRYLDKYYRQKTGWQDGTTQFHQLVAKYLRSEAEVLELGPGPTNPTSDFIRAHCATLDGLDVGEEARQNQALRTAYLYTGGAWPVPEAGYDAVVANYVLEHVADPRSMAADAFRALRPGGVFVFRTPNLWHYVSLVSWLTPHWFHQAVANRLRGSSKEAHDPWPTCYRLNRRGRIRSVFRRAGFEEVELFTIEKEPSYGMYSRPLFYLFFGYERLVNSSTLFAGFRANILGVFVKPAK